jgi:hypothetical protein
MSLNVQGNIIDPNQATEMMVAQMSAKVDEIVRGTQLEKRISGDGLFLRQIPALVHIDAKGSIQPNRGLEIRVNLNENRFMPFPFTAFRDRSDEKFVAGLVCFIEIKPRFQHELDNLRAIRLPYQEVDIFYRAKGKIGIIALGKLGAFEQYDIHLSLMTSHENFLENVPMILPDVRKGFVNTLEILIDMMGHRTFKLEFSHPMKQQSPHTVMIHQCDKPIPVDTSHRRDVSLTLGMIRLEAQTQYIRNKSEFWR